MKANIYKIPDCVGTERYSITVESENELEELALRGLRELIEKKYAEVEIDVMGIGKFIKYGSPAR